VHRTASSRNRSVCLFFIFLWISTNSRLINPAQPVTVLTPDARHLKPSKAQISVKRLADPLDSQGHQGQAYPQKRRQLRPKNSETDTFQKNSANDNQKVA
jgi:hypothetical protein